MILYSYNEWMAHWMIKGFDAFQRLINTDSAFCFGEHVTLADVCLVPQLYNAHYQPDAV